MIERVEVMRGGGSALFGSSALREPLILSLRSLYGIQDN